MKLYSHPKSIVVLVDPVTNVVVNRIVVGWEPPAEFLAVEDEAAQIGWVFDPATGVISAPKETEAEDTHA